MDEEFRIRVELPLDDDRFLRRECPNCEQQFKWYSHEEGDPDAEVVEQYFCPLCGRPAGAGEWWTPDQVEYAKSAAGPDLDRAVQDALEREFRGIKGLTFKPNRDFTLALPTPDPLVEPNDMVAVEPPCHPNEPIKVPGEAADRLHCLICGAAFAA